MPPKVIADLVNSPEVLSGIVLGPPGKAKGGISFRSITDAEGKEMQYFMCTPGTLEATIPFAPGVFAQNGAEATTTRKSILFNVPHNIYEGARLLEEAVQQKSGIAVPCWTYSVKPPEDYRPCRIRGKIDTERATIVDAALDPAELPEKDNWVPQRCNAVMCVTGCWQQGRNGGLLLTVQQLQIDADSPVPEPVLFVIVGA